MTDDIFWDHRNRLALYARILKSGTVKDRQRLFESLVLKPTRKLEWQKNTANIRHLNELDSVKQDIWKISRSSANQPTLS
ncbi:MAG TPA: hypothetical protein VE954_33195 [Oligoflexus sp.]|uniref:hypothetical protein n=1 Tax=Oligoflexus sp. TaxID=1971216 RepID=UPI002D52F2E7|nr:hypothetical protein [Oligoflexus sp.]HYX37983.1 hypothetical protein [Oligoflexus sp.]